MCLEQTLRHIFLACTTSFIPHSSTHWSTATNTWPWMRTISLQFWRDHILGWKFINNQLCANFERINGSNLIILDFECPPKIKRNISSYSMAIWFNFGDGSMLLQQWALIRIMNSRIHNMFFFKIKLRWGLLRIGDKNISLLNLRDQCSIYVFKVHTEAKI
jgi:hypothetical protein